MSQLSLGAIHKLTGAYVYPKIANKKDDYICSECNKDLILCQGEIRNPYFRHKVDSINPCHHYSNPTESQIHKDAKMLMKTLLETKIPIQFQRECVSCKIHTEIVLPEIIDGSIIKVEHRFNYEDTLKIADVAHTHNGEIKGIYEICNTHKTCSENRPEPWVEIDAKTLLGSVTINEQLLLSCIRCEKCEECIIKHTIEKMKYNSRINGAPHKRLDFDGGFFKNNKEICDIFNEDLIKHTIEKESENENECKSDSVNESKKVTDIIFDVVEAPVNGPLLCADFAPAGKDSVPTPELLPNNKIDYSCVICSKVGATISHTYYDHPKKLWVCSPECLKQLGQWVLDTYHSTLPPKKERYVSYVNERGFPMKVKKSQDRH